MALVDGASTDGLDLLVRTPMLKSGCQANLEGGRLMIADGGTVFACSIAAESARAVQVLNDRPNTDDAMHDALTTLVGGDPSAGRSAVDALTRTGLVVEHPNRRYRYFNAEYIGYRLVDAHRSLASRLWNENPLLLALREGGRKDLATGLLLETYFVVRAAPWTAATVLAHHLTATQRQLLQDFFDEEAGHCELMADTFAHLDLDPQEVRRAQPAPESLVYNNYFFGAGHQSARHFAAALIIPEVTETVSVPERMSVDPVGRPRDVLDIIEQFDGIPPGALEGFRAHASLDDDAEHSDFPVKILAEEAVLSREWVETLSSVVAQGVVSYDLYLSGVYRRYDGWDGTLTLGPVLGEF